MRTIKTTSGHDDRARRRPPAVLEALFKTCSQARADHSYEDTPRDRSTYRPDERRRGPAYFAESLFLMHITYENDKLEQVMKKLGDDEALIAPVTCP